MFTCHVISEDFILWNNFVPHLTQTCVRSEGKIQELQTFIEDKNKIVVKLLYGKTDSNNIVKCLTHI